MFKINLEKAKEIHKDNLRVARFHTFNKLDIEFMKALESGNTDRLNEIALQKQQLRDITKAEEIESATSVDGLKAHWPEILESPNPYEVTEE